MTIGMPVTCSLAEYAPIEVGFQEGVGVEFGLEGFELAESFILQESVIIGFGKVHDVELLRPFVDKYFAAIEDVWATRTNEIAQQIVIGLYPTLLADQALVDSSDAWLEGHPDAIPALRRLVSENRDAVARALRVQERDRTA